MEGDRWRGHDRVIGIGEHGPPETKFVFGDEEVSFERVGDG